MKKLLLTLFGVLIALPFLARDFTCTYEGQTLTYTVIDEAAKTVMTKSGNSLDGMAGNKISGNLILPEHPMDGTTRYTLTEIGERAFQYCSDLTQVTISNSVTSIGNGAFSNCSGLTSITIPNSVTEIGDGAFIFCSGLTEVTIPNSVTIIGPAAFRLCENLTSLTIGNSVTSIGNLAFNECRSLTKVTIPNSVTSIGEEVFSCCSGLTQVTIGNSVTKIGFCAFAGCEGLTSIYAYPTVPPTLSNKVFEGVTNTIPVYVPDGSVDAYRNDERWNYFTDFRTLNENGNENGIEAISAEADGDAEYFTLQGIRVKTDKLAPGIYIRRCGNRTDKLLVK